MNRAVRSVNVRENDLCVVHSLVCCEWQPFGRVNAHHARYIRCSRRGGLRPPPLLPFLLPPRHSRLPATKMRYTCRVTASGRFPFPLLSASVSVACRHLAAPTLTNNLRDTWRRIHCALLSLFIDFTSALYHFSFHFPQLIDSGGWTSQDAEGVKEHSIRVRVASLFSERVKSELKVILKRGEMKKQMGSVKK